MMAKVSCLVMLGVPAGAMGQHPDGAMPVRVTGDWSVEVGPGEVELAGRLIALPDAVALDVPPGELVEVAGERYAKLRAFNPDTAGWVKGDKLRGLITQECTATGKLVPESVVVRTTADGQPCVLDTDYAIDPFWGTFGRIEGGAIGAEQEVLVDYTYGPDRLDSIVVNEQGQIRLIAGEPSIGAFPPPEPGDGETAVVNIWVPGRTTELSDDNLYPIQPLPEVVVEPTADQLLPKTLAKLRAGEDVTIVSWGDSVTCGGGVGAANVDGWYQNQFAARLQARFPQANVKLITAGWGGRNSRIYMDQPRGAEKDFVRDLLEPKPDLVTIEFVNDAGLNEEQVKVQYDEIMGHMNGIGAEVILITPHLVRPDWLGKDTMKFDEDPRAYVRGLRAYAAENSIGLADASALWTRLWRLGIPYMTIEANSINHPDERGHKLFADALMAAFPAE